MAVLLTLKLCPDAPQRSLQAGARARLEQVVYGLHLEGLQGELLVGGDENNERQPWATDLVDHVETVQFRHLNVQENQIRLEAIDGFNGFAPTGGGANDFDIGLVLKQALEHGAAERLVVGDQRANLQGPFWRL